MSKKASPLLIGVFVVGALILTVIGIFTFGSRDLFSDQKYFILYFPDSINGLEIGSPVKFKGVQIGEVDEIQLYLSPQNGATYISTIIKIHKDLLKKRVLSSGSLLDITQEKNYKALIAKGLAATVQLKSYVTGLLYIELDYFSEKKVTLLNTDSPYWEIPTVPSGVEEVSKTASDILRGLKKIDYEEFARRVTSIVKNLDDGIKAIKFKKINDGMLGATKKAKTFFQDGSVAAHSVKNAADQVNHTFNDNSPIRADFSDAMQQMGSAAKAIEALGDFLERNPSALLRGKQTPQERLNSR